MTMNRETELKRIRFMLGEHAKVLDLASSTMEILESANAMGYRGPQNDDDAWAFSYPKIKAAVAAFNHLNETDRRAKAFGEWCHTQAAVSA